MEKLDPYKLSPDPLTKARFNADCETFTVSGFIKNQDKKTISICLNQNSKTYFEYPIESIVAAFKPDEESNKVLLLIKKETQVRTVSYGKPQENDCKCSNSQNQSFYIDSFLSRPHFGRGYGQDCFYDCIDEHVGHGDDPNSPGLHRHCENRCSISMPRMRARLPRFMMY